MGHVASRVDVDEHAHKGHHAQHDHGQLIDLQLEIYAEGAGDHPGEVVVKVRQRAAEMPELANQFGDGNERKRHGTYGYSVHSRLLPVLPEQAVDRRTRKRQRQNDPEMVEYGHQNLSRFTRSTLSDSRFCVSVITIASPTAASAAATTMTKKTKTRPSS